MLTITLATQTKRNHLNKLHLDDVQHEFALNFVSLIRAENVYIKDLIIVSN